MTDICYGQTSKSQDDPYQGECGGAHQNTFFRANFYQIWLHFL